MAVLRPGQNETVVVAYQNLILLYSTDDTEFKLSIFIKITPFFTE